MDTQTDTDKCPFEWGDRIDHKLFGFGTVNGEPSRSYGGDSRTFKTIKKGWSVPVKWDDPDRQASTFSSNALRLVTRPDAKGGQFWGHEYEKLLKQVTEARAATEVALKQGFRPNEGSGLTKIDRALNKEQVAIAKLKEFLEADEAGDHP